MPGNVDATHRILAISSTEKSVREAAYYPATAVNCPVSADNPAQSQPQDRLGRCTTEPSTDITGHEDPSRNSTSRSVLSNGKCQREVFSFPGIHLYTIFELTSSSPSVSFPSKPCNLSSCNPSGNRSRRKHAQASKRSFWNASSSMTLNLDCAKRIVSWVCSNDYTDLLELSQKPQRQCVSPYADTSCRYAELQCGAEKVLTGRPGLSENRLCALACNATPGCMQHAPPTKRRFATC